MRVILLVGLFVAVGLAGCVNDEPASTGDGGVGNPEMEELPDRRFEPELDFEAAVLELESGDELDLSYMITDLHDYEFPLTFIDWQLFYSREPNAIDEGDGTQLPGSYQRVLFAEAFHVFTFVADDGQGFKDSSRVIVKVGDPDPEEVIEAVEEANVVLDSFQRTWKAYLPEDCPLCVDGELATGEFPGAEGCAGWVAGINGQDCAWVQMNPGAAGNAFHVIGAMTPGGEDVGLASSPDVEFWTSCHADDKALLDQSYIVPSSGAEINGIVPKGAGCMVVFDFSWPSGGITLDMEWTEANGEFTEIDMSYIVIDPGYCSIGNYIVASCEREYCAGLSNGWNGFGCAYQEIPPNAVGETWQVIAEVDAVWFTMDECTPGTEMITPPSDSGSSETGTVAAGEGCIAGNAWLGDPTIIRFTIGI